MRPLVMDFTDDPVALNTGDEFMFGDAFLVCPVCEYGLRSRKVYLPSGLWYEWYGGTQVQGGGEVEAEAPFEHIPVYVRAGQIVPVGPDIQSTVEDDGSTLTLMVFPGADAAYRLYEDNGVDYAYEKGAWSEISFSWDDASGVLSAGERKGSFPEMAKSKSVTVKVIGGDSAREAKFVYDGSPVSVSL